MGPGGFALCAVLGWAARCARGRRPARSPSATVPPGVLADPWLSCGCGPGCAAAVGRVALRLWAGLRCGCGLGCAAAVGWVALRLWAGLRRGRRPARSPSAARASLGASTRCPARPGHRPRAPQPRLASRCAHPCSPDPTVPSTLGVCSIRRVLSACRRRVAPLMMQFPPFGAGDLVAWSVVAAKVQTTSVIDAQIGPM